MNQRKCGIGEWTAVGLMCLSLSACSNMPGDAGTQGAVAGGVGGAAAGAVIGGSEHRALGALIGGAAGAAGGYLIGANKDKILGKDEESAREAMERAQSDPATAQEALAADTADINNDGFVTLDEVVALENAGFDDESILSRMQATGQVFELTAEQKQYLINNGVTLNVVQQMDSLNQNVRDEVITRQPSSTSGDEVIGR